MSASLFSSLPVCPSNVTTLAFPSLFVTFSVTAVASFVFVLMVAFKYNNVRVFDHRIRTPSISNTLWITFYMCVFLDSLLSAVRLALPQISLEVTRDRYFETATLTLHGLSALALSMALNHQRRFRSGSVNLDEETETDPLLKRVDRLKRILSGVDVFFMLICVAYIVLAWLAVLFPRPVSLKWAFLGAFFMQRIPPLVLSAMIIFFPKVVDRPMSNGTVSEAHDVPEGPSKRAKWLLGLATVLTSVSGDVPLSLWALATGPKNCVFWLASWVDLFHVLYVTGLILYFGFVRSEFLRNMEECIWGAVQDFQKSFTFRKF